MARSSRSRHSRSTNIRVSEFRWPAMQLYFWLVTVLATAAVLIGVFASFIQVQNQMGLGQPWCVPPSPPSPFEGRRKAGGRQS
jgi:hypothetical protein